MAEQSNDLFMKFELMNGLHVAGEAISDLGESKSTWAKGFRQGSMFEVDSFSFQAGIGGEDIESQRKNFELGLKNAQIEKRNRENRMQHDIKYAKSDSKPTFVEEKPEKITSVGQFKKFREGKDVKYPIDLQPVSFERSIDRSSTALLQYCIRRTVFKSATLIKRKAGGTKAAGEVYLRIDFNTVLLTQVDWDEDDPIKEKCSFISRAITLRYRPQRPDGTLGEEYMGFWTMSDLKPTKI